MMILWILEIEVIIIMIKTLEDRREKNVKPHVFFSCGLYQAKETVLMKRIEVASALGGVKLRKGLSLFFLKV